MNSRLTRLIWLLPIGWMVALHILLTMEVDPEPPAWAFPHVDKLIHFGLFTALAWLWFVPLRWRTQATSLLGAGLAFLFASLYGGWTEYVQSTLPHRHGNLWDVLANALGAATILIPPLRARLELILNAVRKQIESA